MPAPFVEPFSARTPTLLPATHTNSYALGDRELLLIEPATPYDDERARWLEWARSLVSQGRRLVAIVCTHHHPDHIGGAAFFADALGAPIWASAETSDRISAPVARKLVNGESLVLDGPTPQRWDVMITPGHAPGHVCLFEPSLSALIAGDMVASEGTILIAPGDGDMREYISQLRRLGALDPAVTLPAHGAPIPRDIRIFSRYVEHRLLRESRVLAAIEDTTEARSADQLLPVVYGDVAPEIWMIAKLSLLAHLDKLVAEGRVSLDGDLYRVISS